MAGFTFNFCVEEEEHVDNGATKGACAEPLDKADKRHSCYDTSVTLSQTKEVDGNGGDTADLEAKELVILPFHKELVDHVTPHTFDIPGGSLKILYVDSASVERVETTKTHDGPNTNPDSDTKTGMKNCNIFNQPLEPETGLVKLLELSNCSHSDLIPGVYEGGLKVWECAFDLVVYLANSDIHFSGKSVIELGCGAGLPAIKEQRSPFPRLQSPSY